MLAPFLDWHFYWSLHGLWRTLAKWQQWNTGTTHHHSAVSTGIVTLTSHPQRMLWQGGAATVSCQAHFQLYTKDMAELSVPSLSCLLSETVSFNQASHSYPETILHHDTQNKLIRPETSNWLVSWDYSRNHKGLFFFFAQTVSLKTNACVNNTLWLQPSFLTKIPYWCDSLISKLMFWDKRKEVVQLA